MAELCAAELLEYGSCHGTFRTSAGMEARMRGALNGLLTNRENVVMSLVWSHQPVTAYRIRRFFADSIVTHFTNNTGTIYPIIRRLVERGLLVSTPVEESRRGAETLTCSPEGEAAVAAWIRQIDGADMVLEDPLRTKMAAMDVLSPAERLTWLRDLQAAMSAELVALQSFADRNRDMSYQLLLHDNARSTLVSRIEWVSRAQAILERGE